MAWDGHYYTGLGPRTSRLSPLLDLYPVQQELGSTCPTWSRLFLPLLVHVQRMRARGLKRNLLCAAGEPPYAKNARLAFLGALHLPCLRRQCAGGKPYDSLEPAWACHAAAVRRGGSPGVAATPAAKPILMDVTRLSGRVGDGVCVGVGWKIFDRRAEKKSRRRAADQKGSHVHTSSAHSAELSHKASSLSSVSDGLHAPHDGEGCRHHAVPQVGILTPPGSSASSPSRTAANSTLSTPSTPHRPYRLQRPAWDNCQAASSRPEGGAPGRFQTSAAIAGVPIGMPTAPSKRRWGGRWRRQVGRLARVPWTQQPNPESVQREPTRGFRVWGGARKLTADGGRMAVAARSRASVGSSSTATPTFS